MRELRLDQEPKTRHRAVLPNFACMALPLARHLHQSDQHSGPQEAIPHGRQNGATLFAPAVHRFSPPHERRSVVSLDSVLRLDQTMPQATTLPATYRSEPPNGLPEPHARGDGGGAVAGMVWTLLRYWRVLALGALVSAAIAFAVGQRFCRKSWQAEGTLLFSPFPVPDNLRGEYNPPSSQTLIQLVKSRQNVERLRQDFDLQMPGKTFDKLINVTQPTNAELVTVTLEWAEPDTGAALVNRLMELHVEHVAQLRKAKVAESMKGLEASRDHALQRLAARRKAYEDFEKRCGVQNIALELDRLQREAATLEQNLAIPRNSLRTAQNQEARFHELLDGRATASQTDVEPLGGGSSSQTYQTRQVALRDLLQTAEFRYLESTKEYEAKLQNYNTLKTQARTGIVSKYELDQGKADLELARIKRNNNQSAIEQHKKEIQALPARYAEGRKAELAEQIAAIKADIAVVDKLVTDKRNQAREMARLLTEAEPYTKAIKEAEDEVSQANAQIMALQRLSMHETNEFVIESPGVSVAYPTSTRKKLTVTAFAVPMLFAIGAILAYDRRKVLVERVRELRQSVSHK